jgi:rubredoxin
MKLTHFKVNLCGGIVSPGTLLQLCNALQQYNIFDVSFGLRQQLLITTKAQTERGSTVMELKDTLNQLQLQYEQDSNSQPNIISSYCAEEVFPTGQWLSEGIYQEIFDSFNFRPSLKVNISDSLQSFTPFFTGNLNFIASNTPNFWYLYVRFKQSNEIRLFPVLIYSLDIANICKLLEDRLLSEYFEINESVFDGLYENTNIITNPIGEELVLPKFSLPYYEGFNRYGDKTWLGIYRRHELFRVDFLIELCQLCLETKIGQICVTPWKSLIIKGIEKNHRRNWDMLLGKYGINVRHAANELNWQIEEKSAAGLTLKKHIIREFDAYDVRSFGLCFAIQTQAKSELFASVIIKKRVVIPYILNVYDIYHTTDYNPNTREYSLFEKGVNKLHVPEILQRITKKYYADQSKKMEPVIKQKTKASTQKTNHKKWHQCPNCHSIYDDNFGDYFNENSEIVTFDKLPSTYTCGICETPKENFVAIPSNTELN